MTDQAEYVLDRIFKAPRDMVWRAWTDPELLQRWYGPGVDTIIHQFDLKVGGEWRNEMKWGDKSDLSKMVFQEVTPKDRLIWLHSSTDQDWNVIANPMMENWPKTFLTTVSFEDQGPETKVRLAMVPVDASEAEIECFSNMMAGMDKGWGGGYAIMDEIFAELLAAEKG